MKGEGLMQNSAYIEYWRSLNDIPGTLNTGLYNIT
jgi:hypothetical protein